MARLETYGGNWPNGYPQHLIELSCWSNYLDIPAPQIERWRHLKNAIILMDKEMRDGWNDWTEKMCWAYGTYDYVAALGCTTSTKTHTFHKLGYYDFVSSPLKTAMSCTTTNSAGLDQRMWPIVSSTFGMLKKTGFFDVWKMTVSPNKVIRPQDKETKHTIRGVTIRHCAEKQEVVDQLIGAHSERRIWIVDEATSAPPAVQSAWANAMAATRHKRLIMLGNPYDYADSLAMFCQPIMGWDSVNEDTEQWEFQCYGEKGIGLHFHGKNSPNIIHGLNEKGKERWPFLYDHATYNNHQSIKETDPIAYWRMYVGWFMPEGSSRRVCSMAAIDRQKCKNHALFKGGDIEIFASLDPAFGGDRCMLMIWQKGWDMVKRKVVMDLIETVQIPLDPKGMPGEQIGRFVKKKCFERGASSVGIDTTTNNSACAEWLTTHTDLKIYWIPFGGAASDDRVVSPNDDRICKEVYFNKAAELAFSVSNNLDIIHGLDQETCSELCSRYWRPIGEKPTRQQLETKAEYRDRMKKSPDRADCVAIGVEVFRLLGGLNAQSNPQRTNRWNSMATRKNSIWNSTHTYSNS
jgi:hypothetical protein